MAIENIYRDSKIVKVIAAEAKKDRIDANDRENADKIVSELVNDFNPHNRYLLAQLMAYTVSEIIKPGAFTNSISGDIRALINHDTSLVLGRTKSGTLTLKQDERGLWGSVRINRDDVDAMNLYARVQRGDVDQCSFGFAIKSETFRDLGNGKYRWEIEEIDPLYEVSVCTFPAYEQTSVSARKRDFEEIEKRRLETWRAEMNKKLGGNP